MRLSPALLALMVSCALLSACGQKTSSAPDQAATPTEPASAPVPPPPTPDQAKALVASLPAPYNTADPEAGKARFTQCAACHTAGQGGPNMTGPNLYGIFGRKAGSLPNFYYSDGLKASGIVWDAPHIDKWITSPKAVVPDTHMTFVGMPDAKDRANVIAYLKVATSPAP